MLFCCGEKPCNVARHDGFSHVIFRQALPDWRSCFHIAQSIAYLSGFPFISRCARVERRRCGRRVGLQCDNVQTACSVWSYCGDCCTITNDLRLRDVYSWLLWFTEALWIFLNAEPSVLFYKMLWECVYERWKDANVKYELDVGISFLPLLPPGDPSGSRLVRADWNFSCSSPLSCLFYCSISVFVSVSTSSFPKAVSAHFSWLGAWHSSAPRCPTCLHWYERSLASACCAEKNLGHIV